MASTKKVKKKPVTHSSLVSCHLQVISSNSSELTPSLYLFTDNRRFVFNCGENFQRFVTDHRLRILKDLMFFFTRVTWRNLGGFLGTSLTYRDGGNTHLNVYGPGRLAQFIELVRYFVGREKLKLVTNWDNSDVPRAIASTVASTYPNDVMTTSPSTHVYSDENVTITLVELEPKSVTESEYRISREAKKVDEISSLDLDDREDIISPEPKRMKYNEDHSPLPCSTAAYICKVADVRGKFNVARAKELGLREGLAYKKLASGKSVTAPNGRVVQPSDVLGETRLGPTFIVMECPDREHISAVTSHPKLQTEYFSNTGQEVVLVVHFSPLEVLQDDEYCRWAASFGESTRHLLLNESVCPTDIGLRAWLRVQYPLYLMNPNVHHPPPIFKDRNPERIDLKLSQFFRDPQKAIIIGRSLFKFQLKPREKMGEDLSQVLRPIKDELPQHLDEIRSNDKLTSAIVAGQAMSMSESAVALKPSGGGSTEESSIVENSEDEGLVHQSSTCSSGRELKISISSDFTSTPPSDIIADAIVEAKTEEEFDGRLSELCSDPKPRICDFHGADDAIITFLGTASTEPSKYRNVSGILVHTPNSGNFMLDCGEGSLSQIYRCFPEEVADEIILNLKAIFLSHVHADHHLGTVNVVQKREQLLAAKKRAQEMASTDSTTSDNDDVVIIAPGILTKWIIRYGELIEKLPCKLINCCTLTKDEIENDRTKKNSAGVEDFHFETVPVIHCSDAYGVVVRHATGWSVVYSGDTRPCPRLIEAGQGASLLIHEATLEDKFLDLAVVKKHCTVSEALEVSDKMAPGFTILTHFSQRDPMIPSFLMTNQQLHSRVAIAMDCMSVNLKQLDQLPNYLPVMRDIFTEVRDDKST
jgi:ribonuclease Z